MQLQKSETEMSTWIVMRAVEELIKIHAPENWARSFVKELNQAKKHKAFNEDDAGSTAQYLCKSLFIIVYPKISFNYLKKLLLTIIRVVVVYSRVKCQAAWVHFKI